MTDIVNVTYLFNLRTISYQIYSVRTFIIFGTKEEKLHT